MNYEELQQWIKSHDRGSTWGNANTVITDTRLPIYGIPMTPLRKMAKTVPVEVLQQAQWDSYEEVLVLGLAVAYGKLPFEKKLPYIRQVLPHLDSWAHTDSIVPTLKLKEADQPSAWAFALECLESDREYTIRFGVIMLMDYFLDGDKLPQTLALLQKIRDERYYVRMAVAWCLAEAAVKQLQPVLDILRRGSLDVFTHNKTIQKMRESYRIDADTKAAIRLLKRKEQKI